MKVLFRLLPKYTDLLAETGIWNAKTDFPFISNNYAVARIGTLNLDTERNVPIMSCSIFSGFSIPMISWVNTLFILTSFTPSIIIFQQYWKNALTVSHIDLGRPPVASFTSKSPHSISLSLSSNSSSFMVLSSILCVSDYSCLSGIIEFWGRMEILIRWPFQSDVRSWFFHRRARFYISVLKVEQARFSISG